MPVTVVERRGRLVPKRRLRRTRHRTNARDGHCAEPTRDMVGVRPGRLSDRACAWCRRRRRKANGRSASERATRGAASSPRPAPQAPPGRRQGALVAAFGPAPNELAARPRVVVYWPHRAPCLVALRIVVSAVRTVAAAAGRRSTPRGGGRFAPGRPHPPTGPGDAARGFAPDDAWPAAVAPGRPTAAPREGPHDRTLWPGPPVNDRGDRILGRVGRVARRVWTSRALIDQIRCASAYKVVSNVTAAAG